MNNEVKEEVNLKEILKPYLRHWRWFFICGFLALILGLIYIKFTQPVYKIQTSVLIKDASRMSSAAGDFNVMQGLAGGAIGTNSIENEMEIFKSRQIAEKVVKELKIQTPIYSREKYYDVELYKDTSPVSIQLINEKENAEPPKNVVDISIKGDKIILSSKEFDKDIITTFNKTVSLPYANFIITKNPNFNISKVKDLKFNDLYFKFISLNKFINDFQKNLDVELVEKEATVIGLSINNTNRQKAKDILNTIVTIYNTDAITDKNIESKRTKDFIDDRISIISRELGDVENQKEKFREENKLYDIKTQVELNLESNSLANKAYLDFDTQLELNNVLLNYMNNQGNTEILPVNIGLDNVSVAKSIETYNGMVMKRNKLLENATPQNPLVQELTSQIQNAQKSIKEGLLKNKSALQLSKNQAISEFDKTNREISKIPTQEKDLRNIERQQRIKENLYLVLLQKREEAAISLAMTANKARVIDYAYASEKPDSPKKLMIIGGAIMLGMLFPFLYIYVTQLLDDKIHSRHDLERFSDSAVILAEIPRLGKKESELIKPNDITPSAEAFRILITNLRFMLPKQTFGNVIMVTSSVKGEGKTFVSVNMAITMSNAKNKVLIIGADIRNPQLQRYNIEMKKAKGVTEFLYGEINSADEIIHKDIFAKNCDVIYSGSIPPNPTDLLDNQRLQELLNQVKDDYNYILLDTAPLMLVTDSFLISDYADVTVYVTRSEYTENKFIDFANKSIAAGKIKNTAFVLNAVHKRNFGYANTYGYGYHHDNKGFWEKLKEKIFG